METLQDIAALLRDRGNREGIVSFEKERQESLAFGDLERTSRQLARALPSTGLKSAILLAGNSPQWIADALCEAVSELALRCGNC